MKLRVENKEEVSVNSFEIIKKNLKSLKSYGPHSYAIMSDDSGSFLQVGGGQFTCFVERYDAKEKKIYRACHENSSTNFEDGSVLAFGGGTVKLDRKNWFNIDDVINIFEKFFFGESFGEDVYWELLKLIDPD